MQTSTKKITIGIQARSTSKRFPRKVHQYLRGSTILMQTIKTCEGSAFYLNSKCAHRGYSVGVSVCVPSGDEIVSKYQGNVDIFEGSETDVLDRYLKMAEHHKSDLIVRVTSDCPLIPQNLISTHVLLALKKGYDYLSNVDESCRTFMDGMDCEIFSYDLLKYAAEHATDPYDREHVTPFMRNKAPSYFKIGFAMAHIDHSDIKLSVDTPEDLDRMKGCLDRTLEKHRKAVEKYGKSSVHWI